MDVRTSVQAEHRRPAAVLGWLILATGLMAAKDPAWAQQLRPSSTARRVSFVSQDVSSDDPADDDVDDADDILKLADESLESLSNRQVVAPALDVEVTSVTRTESTVGRSPAAIFVITPEMIRRSGATSVPEALRMAPGLEVARVNSNEWAVSSRGFNSRFANKLLVQIDGRSIYSPVFSGTFWEANHVMLEDVERIEVIRGPGATVWGANAVNGVINIITKSAKDTQGLLFSGGAGTEERGFTNLRYGGTTQSGVNWRVYGMQFDRDGGTLPGGDAVDDWRFEQGGFRADWQPTCCDTVTFQGDYFNGDTGNDFLQQFPAAPFTRRIAEDTSFRGGNVLMRWSRDLGQDRGWAVQCYYDRFEHHLSPTRDDTDTIDFDFQREFPLGWRHKLLWGCGYRYHKVRTRGTFSVSYDPSGRDLDLFSYFLQDQITLSPERLFLTVGSKFEHNDFTAFEFQPTARLLWAPDPRRAVWAAVSRAVRTPSITDENTRIKIFNIPVGPPPPVFAQLSGDRAVESEDLTAYEVGYRAQPTDAFSWDIAVFFNKYEDLIVFNPPPLGFPAPSIWSWPAVNGMNGETYGGELSATLQVNPCWRLTGSYSYLQMQVHPDVGIDSDTNHVEHQSPHSQVYCRSSWDFAHDLQFDLMLRYVDSLHTHRGITSGRVPKYLTMDVRLGWRPSENLEVAVVGQNLLDDHHLEFHGQDAFSTEVDRGVYGTVTLQY